MLPDETPSRAAGIPALVLSRTMAGQAGPGRASCQARLFRLLRPLLSGPSGQWRNPLQAREVLPPAGSARVGAGVHAAVVGRGAGRLPSAAARAGRVLHGGAFYRGLRAARPVREAAAGSARGCRYRMARGSADVAAVAVVVAGVALDCFHAGGNPGAAPGYAVAGRRRVACPVAASPAAGAGRPVASPVPARDCGDCRVRRAHAVHGDDRAPAPLAVFLQPAWELRACA